MPSVKGQVNLGHDHETWTLAKEAVVDALRPPGALEGEKKPRTSCSEGLLSGTDDPTTKRLTAAGLGGAVLSAKVVLSCLRVSHAVSHAISHGQMVGARGLKAEVTSEIPIERRSAIA